MADSQDQEKEKQEPKPVPAPVETASLQIIQNAARITGRTPGRTTR